MAEALLVHRGKADGAVVDCLTLWISNLLLERDESYAAEKIQELIERLTELDFHIVFITNEVGSGIVPDNPLARQFRDLCGRMNQQVAQIADEVVLMIAKLPSIIKKDSACF